MVWQYTWAWAVHWNTRTWFMCPCTMHWTTQILSNNHERICAGNETFPKFHYQVHKRPPRDQIWFRPTQSAHSYSLGAFAKLRKATISFVMSVGPSARNPVPTEQILMKFLCFIIFLKSVEKIQVSLKSDNNNGYLTGRPTYISDHTSLSSSEN
jgi:hypothetical protein